MATRKGYKQLVDEAKSRIKTISVDQAKSQLGKADVLFVDLRDIRELEREGQIPGAFHCPRGMLEFWIDPDSPYYKDAFAPGKQFVFYCQSAWRSALAADTAQQMGMENVTDIEGGFAAWKTAGMPVEERKKKA
ncbi:MAG TPA: rhodanese-like domain-containing protein [Methylomirabilota bacterium]|jgi:rhodanese-related sulfurtransferase|nr:rhodanese-like domain-containing protein [Methylomirabilota bacterium]